MEFLSGELMSQRLEKGAQNLREGLNLGRPIAVALDLAHKKGIVHREVLLIDSDCRRFSGI